MNIFPALILSFGLAALPASAGILDEEAPRLLEIEARVLAAWQWGSVGAGESTEAGDTGTSLDSRSELGLSRPGYGVRLAATLYIGAADRVRFDAAQWSFSGSADLRRDFTYDDDFFTSGWRVSSLLRIRTFALSWEHRFVDGTTEVWSGPGLASSETLAGISSSPEPAGKALEETHAYAPLLQAGTLTRLGSGFSLLTHARFAPCGLPRFWASDNRLYGNDELASTIWLDASLALRFQPVHFASVELGLEAFWFHQYYRGEEADRISFGNNRVRSLVLAPFLSVRVAF